MGLLEPEGAAGPSRVGKRAEGSVARVLAMLLWWP